MSFNSKQSEMQSENCVLMLTHRMKQQLAGPIIEEPLTK